ncbi:MAG TPA: type I methionyl aminopeptidase [bacterium]
MIQIKTAEEIERMREAGLAVAQTLAGLRELVRPGVTTRELDRYAESTLRARGMRPAFKGYRGYPASICASPNEVVVHGIPSERRLAEGDILSIDVGAEFEGYFGDAAVTLPVGRIAPEAERLLRVTEEALARGLEQARPGNRLHDISWAIQSCAEEAGYGVVRDYVGHGIGRAMHEDPQVPNYGRPGSGPRLQAGMVLAIEPMINAGGAGVEVLADGWTVVTADRRLSAHFEHTVAIREEGPDVLTLPARA